MNDYSNPQLRFDNIPEGKTGWRAPSNIALVKYWGKRAVQLPMNPSLSFTLSDAVSETVVEYAPASGKKPTIKFDFQNQENLAFAAKTEKFFETVSPIFPFLEQFDFVIRSHNSFPHSAGIASSASGMGALALTLCSIEKSYFNTFENEEAFFKKASYVARLGSGSACRSVYGGAVVSGETKEVENSSDYFGIPVTNRIHPIFTTYHDTILLVDEGTKKVSSRAGHALMESNPYAAARFQQAGNHLSTLLAVMAAGDLERFVSIVESEALSLHAMMMTSNPYYLLVKPNTIAIINKIFELRNETGIPLCFTLDAGPNIHLLYPDEDAGAVKKFIQSELTLFLSPKGMIDDRMGKGPEKLNI